MNAKKITVPFGGYEATLAITSVYERPDNVFSEPIKRYRGKDPMKRVHFHVLVQIQHKGENIGGIVQGYYTCPITGKFDSTGETYKDGKRIFENFGSLRKWAAEILLCFFNDACTYASALSESERYSAQSRKPKSPLSCMQSEFGYEDIDELIRVYEGCKKIYEDFGLKEDTLYEMMETLQETYDI